MQVHTRADFATSTEQKESRIIERASRIVSTKDIFATTEKKNYITMR